MTAQQRKKDFVEWAKRYNDHKYTLSTISSYAGTLQKLNTIWNIDLEMDFFEISSEEEFLAVKKRIEEKTGWVEFNRQYQHGVISAALGLYYKYIVSNKEFWWPSQEEYTPDISKEQWLELLHDDAVFTQSSLEVMAALYAVGGQSSCVALAEQYGGTSDLYRMTSVHLAERVVKKTGCRTLQGEDNSKWWPVLYLGRNTKKEERGNYVWKLRPELHAALEGFDILRYLVKRGEKQLTIRETLQQINSYIASKGYTFDKDLITNYYLSLKSKPFVILAGISGTGKSKLVRLFAEACGATTENGQFKLLPVKPDWSDASDLLGYVDLERRFKAGEVLCYIHEASKPENVDKPYFLCLDEMNLARVEYYFSDFLSVIETRKMEKNGKIVTDPIVSKSFCEPDTDAVNEYAGLTIPENLYVIGTVNMDETTFPFSRKVLDRANTIEFSFVNLVPTFVEKQEVSVESISNSVLKSEYLQLPKDKELQPQIIEICEELQKLNDILESCYAQVAYRVRDEAVAYLLVNRREDLIKPNAAMDNIIMQKMLPRLQGNSGALKRALCEMFIHCADKFEGSEDVLRGDIAEHMHSVLSTENKYPRSAKKIYDMVRRFEEDGFTSFWS